MTATLATWQQASYLVTVGGFMVLFYNTLLTVLLYLHCHPTFFGLNKPTITLAASYVYITPMRGLMADLQRADLFDFHAYPFLNEPWVFLVTVLVQGFFYTVCVPYAVVALLWEALAAEGYGSSGQVYEIASRPTIYWGVTFGVVMSWLVNIAAIAVFYGARRDLLPPRQLPPGFLCECCRRREALLDDAK